MIEVIQGAESVAPASIHWKIGNVLSAGLKRERLTSEQAQQALMAYAKITVLFVEVDLAVPLEIAAERDLYAYDAYLITAALRQRAPLLTTDAGLARAQVFRSCRWLGRAMKELRPT